MTLIVNRFLSLWHFLRCYGCAPIQNYEKQGVVSKSHHYGNRKSKIFSFGNGGQRIIIFGMHKRQKRYNVASDDINVVIERRTVSLSNLFININSNPSMN